MSRDLGDLLRETAPEPTQPLDAPALVQRAERQRRRTRAAASALVACIVFIGVAGVVASDAPDVAFRPNTSAQGGGDETGATGGTVPLPPPGSVTAEWVNGEPVWVSNDGGTPIVLDAVNPHEWYGLDELVGWCAASESFEAWFDWSLFDKSGRYLAGPAPTDLPRYTVESAAGGTLLLGAKSMPARSTQSDEASVPACRDEGGDESGGAAAYHGADGSDRQVFEGIIVEGDDGVARFCPGVQACTDESLEVPQAHDLGEEVVEASVLARSDGTALHDVLLVPMISGAAPNRPVAEGATEAVVPRVDGSAMKASPDPAEPGQMLSLRFPQQTERGVAFALFWHDGDVWQRAYSLHSDGGPGGQYEPDWSPAEEPVGFESVGVGGPGPDRVPVPDTARRGRYLVCTANASPDFCGRLVVVEDAAVVPPLSCDRSLYVDYDREYDLPSPRAALELELGEREGMPGGDYVVVYRSDRRISYGLFDGEMLIAVVDVARSDSGWGTGGSGICEEYA